MQKLDAELDKTLIIKKQAKDSNIPKSEECI